VGNLPGTPADWQLWLLAASLPLCFCASRLGNNLWYDEAYTLIHFVSQPWYRIVTDYSAPNNHIFFSLLLRPVYLLSDQEVPLRLPGFAFAVGTLWCTFQIGKHFGGVVTGALATLWLGVTQMFLNYVLEIRGYGLSLFLTSLLGWFALRPLAEERIKLILARIATIGTLAALIWTIPTNLLFAICIGCFVFFRMGAEGTRKILFRDGLCWLVGILVGCMLYLPVLGQLRTTAASSAGWDLGANLWLLGAFFRAALADWLPALGMCTIGFLIGAWPFRMLPGRAASYTRSSSSRAGRGPILGLTQGPAILWGWLLAGLVGPFAVAALLGIRPFVRNFVPALVFLSVAGGIWTDQAVSAFFDLWARLSSLGRKTRTDSPPTFTADRNTAPRLRAPRGEATSLVSGRFFLGAVILIGTVLPRLATYPDRLDAARRRGPVQDGYYNYYAARYRPAEAVRYVAQWTSRGNSEEFGILFRQEDYYPLVYYLVREGLVDQIGIRSKRTSLVFYITPMFADPEGTFGQSGLQEALPIQWQFIGDFGYYCVYVGRVRQEGVSSDLPRGFR
jgi:hypothetical protein